MAIEIIVPRLGWSMDEGTFNQWLRHDGESVNEGDELFELESEKAVQPVESFDSGILRILPDGPEPGDVVKVGQRLGYLCEQGEPAPFEMTVVRDLPDHANRENRSRPNRGEASSDSAAESAANIDEQPASQSLQSSVATPSARRLARELGVDVQKLFVTRSAGRLTENEIRAAVQNESNSIKVVFGTGRTRLRVSPRAARAAADLRVNLEAVTSTGTSGRIREKDVMAVAEQRRSAPISGRSGKESNADQNHPTFTSPGARNVNVAPSSLRKTIASRMLAAAQQTASVTLTARADATELVNVRTQFKMSSADRAIRTPSYTDLLVKLSASALEQHPEMLSQWSDEGIFVADGIHVAVAVDTHFGLLTPVIRDVSGLSLMEVTERLSSLISRARARRLSAEELCGGTYTVTNLGGYRVDAFTPLLNLPQTSILGVGQIGSQPVAVEGRVKIRELMTLSLTFDHRVIDGAKAASFLTTICERVERPLSTLLS